MTQFRYNVLMCIEQSQSNLEQTELTVDQINNGIIHKSNGFVAPAQSKQNLNLIQQHNWKSNPITVEEIKRKLTESQEEILVITNVTNSRINAAIKTANWLFNADNPKTVGRMREMLEDSDSISVRSDSLCGIDPQDWWDLETTLPYSVEITWATETCTGDYDVILIPTSVDANVAFSIYQRPFQSAHSCTNEPLQSNFARQLIPELRQYLRKTLPEYMVPTAFVPLEKLPVNSNGKVDRRALSTLNEHSLHSLHPTIEVSNRNIAALTATERILIDIWKELLRSKHVTIHDNFFELGGHSLLATQMTSRVRDSFGLELPLKSVFEAPTIAQLAPILDTLSNNTAAPTIPPLVHLDRSAYRRKRSTLANSGSQTLPDVQAQPALLLNDPVIPSKPTILESRSPLVPLTLSGSKQPFFCVHPMFGVVFPYLELAHHLGNTRSFYGLQPLGLDGKSPPLDRIEVIAAYYIQAIRTLQPEGPYFLGGWSFGGLVAFEMAQQLRQAGQPIELLAILDTTAPCNKPSFYQSLKFLFGTALWSTLPFLIDYGAIAANRFGAWNWFSRWQWSEVVRQIPQESRLQLMDESVISPMLQIIYAHAKAAYRYVPKVYPDRVTLFTAIEQPNVADHDPTLGWSALANNIQLHSVPGNHLSFLKQPHVQILAQKLRQCLT